MTASEATRGWLGARILGRPRALVRAAVGDSLLRNSSFIMGTTAFTLGLGYVYWVLAAHLYPAAQVGLGAGLVAALTAASTLSNLGVHTGLVQLLPGTSDDREWAATVNAALLVALLTGTVAGAATVSLLPTLSSHFSVLLDNPLAGTAFVASVGLWSAGMMMDYVAIAERASGNMLIRNLVPAVVKLPLVVWPIFIAEGGLGIFYSWVISMTIGLILGIWLIVRLRPGFRLTREGVARRLARVAVAGLRHHFVNLGNTAPLFLLPVIVTARLSAAENAWFYSTWMSCLVFFMISASVSQSLFAEGTHAAASLTEKVRRSGGAIAALLAPAMVVYLLFGRSILELFGPSYARHGSSLLILLTVSAVPDAVTNIYVAVLRVRRQLRLAALLSASMALVTLILTWLLLPGLGLAGAGWAWLTAQVGGTLVVAVHVLRAGRAPEHHG